MALHAFQDVDDAISVTRAFLFPFELRRWLKLAVVAFFVGGGMNLPTAQFDSSSPPGQVPETGVDIPTTVPDDVLPIIAVVVVAAVLLALVFGIVGSIMEFVLVESLRTREVSIRTYWSERWRQGLRLFGFRVAIGLPMLALFLGWLALFVGPLLTGVSTPAVPFAVFLLGLPVIILVGFLYGLVSAFTTVFVVPIMIKDDSGVLDAWRRLWPSIRAEWKQYLAYAVVGFVLTFAAGLVASFVVGLGAVVLLIPLVVVGVLTYVTVSFGSTVGLAVLVLLAVLFVVSLLVLWALVQVPVVAYLRYYALLVLGDVEQDFDVIPDQRAAAREE